MAVNVRRYVPAMVLAIVVCVLSLAPASAYGFSRPTWLVVDKLNITTPTSPGHDSYVMEGSFNMPPATLESTDVTLLIGSTYSVSIPAASWKRVGSSRKFVGKTSGVTGQITFWKGGSSKCTFRFTAVKQTLRPSLPDTDPAEVSVALFVGSRFANLLTAVEDVTADGRHMKLKTLGPDPTYVTRQILVTRVNGTPNRDKLLYVGKLYTAQPYDPATQALYFAVGPFNLDVPAATITAPSTGHTLKYSTTLPSGAKVNLTIDNKLGRYTIVATHLDMSPLTAETIVEFDTSGPGSYSGIWIDEITLQENNAHTVFKY